MAPSSYYAAKTPAPSARARRDEELIPQLIALWESNCCVYGVRKLWKAARRTGIMISRDQVARLMRAAGIEGASRSKRVKTTRPDPTSARHPDLVRREFTATRAVNSRRLGLLRVWLSRGVYAASVTASIIMVSNSTGVSFPSRRCRRLRW